MICSINIVTKMNNLVIMFGFLIFLNLWNSLWSCCELAELKYYQREIEDWLKSCPRACRVHTQSEIEALPKCIALHAGDEKTAESRLRLIGFMKGIKVELEKYHRFKSMCAAGILRSGSIKTGQEWAKFREEYLAFEEESHTPEEIESKCLEYCGVFLAKPSLMSVLSDDRDADDRDVNVPRYKAITEPVYKYLKSLFEELVYYTAWIEMYYELRDEAAIKIQAVFRGYAIRKKNK
mgnify:CR=1 FL=1